MIEPPAIAPRTTGVTPVNPFQAVWQSPTGNSHGPLLPIHFALNQGILAAVETVNPQIAATVDAAALVEEAARGAFGAAVVEGPFGFDNAISAEGRE